MKIKFIVAGCLMMLIGCTSSKKDFVTPIEFARSHGKPSEIRRMSAGDKIILSVETRGLEEIPSTPLEVNLSGNVPAPLIGDVNVNAMTLTEARAALERKYSQIYVGDVRVSIQLEDGGASGFWGYVTVLGSVRSPGRIPVSSRSGINLSSVLHDAGGLNEIANMNNIVVTRNLKKGGKIQCRSDLTKMGLSGTEYMDLILHGGDVVFVHERLF